jgi:ribosomal-protein-alanine N-acetyltransferase
MSTLTRIPIIETPRMVIRELKSRDATDFAAYMLREDYQRHIAVRLASEEAVHGQVIRAVARQNAKERTAFYLAGELKATGTVIADGFILCRGKLAEIGWGVHPDHWRHGLGKELARALLALAFERLNCSRAWSKVMAGNVASLKLARSVGLRPVKSHPDYPMSNGRFEAIEFFTMESRTYFEAGY